jgi:hypothetical protein
MDIPRRFSPTLAPDSMGTGVSVSYNTTQQHHTLVTLHTYTPYTDAWTALEAALLVCTLLTLSLPCITSVYFTAPRYLDILIPLTHRRPCEVNIRVLSLLFFHGVLAGARSRARGFWVGLVFPVWFGSGMPHLRRVDRGCSCSL